MSYSRHKLSKDWEIILRLMVDTKRSKSIFIKIVWSGLMKIFEILNGHKTHLYELFILLRVLSTAELYALLDFLESYDTYSALDSNTLCNYQNCWFYRQKFIGKPSIQVQRLDNQLAKMSLPFIKNAIFSW